MVKPVEDPSMGDPSKQNPETSKQNPETSEQNPETSEQMPTYSFSLQIHPARKLKDAIEVVTGINPLGQSMGVIEVELVILCGAFARKGIVCYLESKAGILINFDCKKPFCKKVPLREILSIFRNDSDMIKIQHADGSNELTLMFGEFTPREFTVNLFPTEGNYQKLPVIVHRFEAVIDCEVLRNIIQKVEDDECKLVSFDKADGKVSINVGQEENKEWTSAYKENITLSGLKPWKKYCEWYRLVCCEHLRKSSFMAQRSLFCLITDTKAEPSNDPNTDGTLEENPEPRAKLSKEKDIPEPQTHGTDPSSSEPPKENATDIVPVPPQLHSRTLPIYERRGTELIKVGEFGLGSCLGFWSFAQELQFQCTEWLGHRLAHVCWPWAPIYSTAEYFHGLVGDESSPLLPLLINWSFFEADLDYIVVVRRQPGEDFIGLTVYEHEQILHRLTLKRSVVDSGRLHLLQSIHMYYCAHSLREPDDSLVVKPWGDAEVFYLNHLGEHLQPPWQGMEDEQNADTEEDEEEQNEGDLPQHVIIAMAWPAFINQLTSIHVRINTQ